MLGANVRKGFKCTAAARLYLFIWNFLLNKIVNNKNKK